MNKPTEDQFLSYQNIFDYFNEVLFEGQLPGVLLNFSRKAKTHGFFAPERWEDGKKSRSHEISLNPETLERESVLVFSTLVHEMVHLWQQEFGKPSRTAYHNQEWADKMESVGLIPSNTGQPGGKKTGQSVSHYILAGGPFENAFEAMPEDLKRLPFTAIEYIQKPAAGAEGSGEGEEDGDGEGKTKKKGKNKSQYKAKFTCPDCGQNAWGKEDLSILCNNCKVLLERQE
jgi:hypothetical protein